MHNATSRSYLLQVTHTYFPHPSLTPTQLFYYLGFEGGIQATMANPRYWEARDSIDRNTTQRNLLFGSGVVDKMDSKIGREAVQAKMPPRTHHPMRDPDTTVVGLGEDSAQMFKGTQRSSNYVVYR